MKRIIYLVIFILISTILHSQSPCPGTATVTYEGKTYNTVLIGTQCWLKENLNVGTQVPTNQAMSNNGTIEKHCYNNDANNCEVYGGLYQWNEVMAYSTIAGSQGICPTGWHIPTKTEFETLRSTVNYDGNSLKAVGQGVDAGAGTNTYGFSALMAGYRHPDNYLSYDLTYSTYFWSSTELDADRSTVMDLIYSSPGFFMGDFAKGHGLSVRCIKDDSGVAIEKENNSVPNEYQLSQNYPNPFNPETTIKYTIPTVETLHAASLQQQVILKVYDLLGREIATLVNGVKSAGVHSVKFDASNLPSGIYIYKIQAGEYSLSKKMILTK